MSTAAIATLVQVPRPWDAEDTCVTRNADGSWNVAWLRGGRHAERFGSSFETAMEACAASRAVRELLGLSQ